MRARFAATLYAVVALALAAFAVPAFAGDHGGGGWGHDHQQAAQQQSGQDQSGSDQQQSSQSGSSGDNSTGVKPSNTTKHDTYASASSNQTKQYGNGKTAGEIATQAGDGSATLHGPGNSQPHKTSCGGHEVDVHALKAHGGDCGQAQQSQGCGSCQSQNTEQGAQVQQAPQEQTKAAEQVQSTHKSCKHHSEQAAQATSQKEQTAQVKAAEVEQEQKKQEQQKQVQQTQAPEVPAVVQMAHVTICHATGSSTNPFVRISPAAAGVFNGHLGHQDARDIIPPFTWNGETVSQNWDSTGQAIWDNGCVQPAQTQAVQSASETQQTQSSCTCPLASQQAQASEENEASEQETQSNEETESAPSPQAAVIQQSPAAVTQAPAVSAQAPAVSAQAPSTATQAPASSGVKGASVVLKRSKAKPAVKPAAKAKPAGGVLGTTTPLRAAVSSPRLPFTGLPLWPFLVAAAVLLAVGLASRFAAADRRT